MAVKIRESKERLCSSCQSNGAKFYDIGIGPIKGKKQITTLCSTCMHTLLQKLIIMGGKHNELQ